MGENKIRPHLLEFQLKVSQKALRKEKTLNKENKKKLEEIVKKRYQRMLCENSLFDVSTSMNVQLHQKSKSWHEYLCSLGMHISDFIGEQGIYVDDPAFNYWGSGRDGYISVPEELAIKILSLGDMP